MHKNFSDQIRVGIFGAAGFSGIELLHLLAAHPHAKVIFASSDQKAGSPVRALTGRTGNTDLDTLKFCSTAEAEHLAHDAELAFLATPATASARLRNSLECDSLRIVDLSGAFRLRDEAQSQAHYQLPAVPGPYGLPELFRDLLPKGAEFIANPGCYATASALALAPLVRGGIIDTRSIVIQAASGVTGAGRKATEDFSFTSVSEDIRAYRVLGHQHEPEIAQTLQSISPTEVELTFTPHLLPVKRGILVTAFARPATPVTDAQIRELYLRDFGAEPFIDLADAPEEVRLSSVVGTNLCQIGVRTDGKRVIVCAAIDNLIKGAAGQAVQNFNRIFGLPETAGLLNLRRYQS
jgi:N-acetyl-gamma-glutamyl-phosphate reductase